MRRSIAAVVAALMAFFSAAAQAHSSHDEHTQHADAAAHRGHVTEGRPDPATVAAAQDVSVQGCWIRALPGRLPAAAYFELKNAGTQPVTLVGAQAEGFGRVMLHTNRQKDGMAGMVHLEEIVVPAGENLAFAPGGHHIMLEQADFDLQVGSQRAITLWFEGPAALTVQCDVRPPATLQ